MKLEVVGKAPVESGACGEESDSRDQSINQLTSNNLARRCSTLKVICVPLCSLLIKKTNRRLLTHCAKSVTHSKCQNISLDVVCPIRSLTDMKHSFVGSSLPSHNSMPPIRKLTNRYSGDYCDVYLTHDSMSVRKAHNTGKNHLRNVVDYYQR